jgi:hypothetical protein
MFLPRMFLPRMFLPRKFLPRMFLPRKKNYSTARTLQISPSFALWRFHN